MTVPSHTSLRLTESRDGGAPQLRISKPSSFKGSDVFEQRREKHQPLFLRPKELAADHLKLCRQRVVALLCLRSCPGASLNPDIPVGCFHGGVTSRMELLRMLRLREPVKISAHECTNFERSTLEIAALMPSWLLLIANLTPRSPRKFRLRPA